MTTPPGLTCHRCNAPISGERDPDERGRLGVGSGAPKAAQAAFEAARQAPRAETEETTHA